MMILRTLKDLLAPFKLQLGESALCVIEANPEGDRTGKIGSERVFSYAKSFPGAHLVTRPGAGKRSFQSAPAPGEPDLLRQRGCRSCS